MARIAVVARKALVFAGQQYEPGDTFDVAPLEAASLRYRQLVDFAGHRRKDSTPDADDPAPAKRRDTRGRYRRRDLTPET